MSTHASPRPTKPDTIPRVVGWAVPAVVDRALDQAPIERTDSTPAHNTGITATAVYGSGVVEATRASSSSLQL